MFKSVLILASIAAACIAAPAFADAHSDGGCGECSASGYLGSQPATPVKAIDAKAPAIKAPAIKAPAIKVAAKPASLAKAPKPANPAGAFQASEPADPGTSSDGGFTYCMRAGNC